MFLFGKKKSRRPVVYARQEHCISRRNIDPDALKVLYRLSGMGYTAYLVGGGVRDLLLGREPKDFDVGTSAKPVEVRRAFRNCFLIGRRFRLAHVKYGDKVIETATFRRESQSVGEILEHAAEGPQEDNTFGTPETDAYRRDFTVNGLFYDIRDFSVIDWVGGMDDLKRRIIRAIGDPDIRFQEDPVRMMRAIKFSSRLDFKIEKKTWAAIKRHHACILNAAIPRVCEEVFRLFTYGHSAAAFRMMWESGLLGDILPTLAEYIARSGGKASPLWKHLAALDKYEIMLRKRNLEATNALRIAMLCAGLCNEMAKEGAARVVVKSVLDAIKIPKTVYFSAVAIMESVRRFSAPPARSKLRFIYSRDFLDALDYNRLLTRTEGRSEDILNQWSDFYDRNIEKETNE